MYVCVLYTAHKIIISCYFIKVNVVLADCLVECRTKDLFHQRRFVPYVSIRRWQILFGVFFIVIVLGEGWGALLLKWVREWISLYIP